MPAPFHGMQSWADYARKNRLPAEDDDARMRQDDTPTPAPPGQTVLPPSTDRWKEYYRQRREMEGVPSQPSVSPLSPMPPAEAPVVVPRSRMDETYKQMEGFADVVSPRRKRR